MSSLQELIRKDPSDEGLLVSQVCRSQKNIQFSDKGFQVVLIADGGATRVSHQFHYFQPAATFVFRLGREEGRRSNEEVQMGNGC